MSAEERRFGFTPAPRSLDYADAVIMQEDVDADERMILVREGVSRGENIRLRGGDLCEGQKVGIEGEPPERAELGRHRLRRA